MRPNGSTVVLAAIACCACTTKNENSLIELTRLVGPITSEALDAGGALESCFYSPTNLEASVQIFNVARDFRMGLVVTNNLPNNSDLTTGRLNTNDFIAYQVVTTFESTDGTVLHIGPQTTPVQGTIPVGATAVVSGVLIPAAAAIQLAQVSSVRLHTHVEGRLLDGSSVSTNEYLPSAIPTSSDQDTSSCVSSSGGGTVASCTPAPNVVPYVGIWREVVFAENDVPGVTCQNIAAIGTACPPDAPPLNCVDDEEVLKLSIGLCQSEQFVGDWYGCLLPQTENFVAYRSDSVCSLNEELSCSFVTATNISCTLSGSSGTSMPPTGCTAGVSSISGNLTATGPAN